MTRDKYMFIYFLCLFDILVKRKRKKLARVLKKIEHMEYLKNRIRNYIYNTNILSRKDIYACLLTFIMPAITGVRYNQYVILCNCLANKFIFIKTNLLFRQAVLHSIHLYFFRKQKPKIQTICVSKQAVKSYADHKTTDLGQMVEYLNE